MIDRLQGHIAGLVDELVSDLVLLRGEIHTNRQLIEQQAARIQELEKALTTFEQTARKTTALPKLVRPKYTAN
jgi:hypothetical protein